MSMSTRDELQSKETDMILNTIDELRSIGIGNILELPQIIVCGDQSSGKSSVLNAVSTLKFPIRDGLCTRFATEVIMRPGSPEHIVVSIVPGTGHSLNEKRNLEAFQRKQADLDDIEGLIAEATATMGINPEDPQARRFSDDILRFEVTGPDQPSLTLVDLPGLFQTSSRYQTEKDVASVRELVLKYMRNKRSVMLAVISAKSEFVLQSVTKYTREVDERGQRTLGIITKPDKLDVGSDSERKFLELAENQLAHLHRGWHVLVNRDHNTRDYTQAQRDDAERQFLSTGVWNRLPSSHKGVFTLRSRLSDLLRDQILAELSDLIGETEDEITHCKTRLSKLGVSRATAEDRRRYLVQAAQAFNIIMRSCVNGSYDDKFFGNEHNDENKEKRLRAIIQNTLMAYSEYMHEFGHARHIIDDSSEEEDVKHPHRIAKERFEDVVMELMKHSRGRELMGTHNPMIVSELFQTQSEPWIRIAQVFQSRIWRAARKSIDLVLEYVTDENTKLQLEKHVIQPALNRVLASLNAMTKRLLKPRLESHPITYNRRLAESVQRAKQASAEKAFAEKYERVINTRGEVVSKDTLKFLFKEQILVPPVDLARYAASEAIDIMRAYYKIAKETMVDNFSSLAIEDCLVSQLPNIFSPETVANLDDDTISDIAMETDIATSDRAEIGDRLERCASALAKLRNIDRTRATGLRSSKPKDLPFSLRPEIIDDIEGSERQIGTELSKLDLGFSDMEDNRTSTSDSEDDSDDSQGSQRNRKKKVLRDTRVEV